MSFKQNTTGALWQGFMPRRKEICNPVGSELYSVEIYRPGFFDGFEPGKKFENWAAIEVSDFNDIPDNMETLILPEGLYAVFLHKGPASEGPKTYGYIFNTWLPASNYTLDDRPHFALMGDKYKLNNPDSEEELWIPISLKSEKSYR